MAFEIGSRVGDYAILARIGAGGAGQVYKARHVVTGRVEALKVLQADVEGSRDLSERFLREIRLQASLDHSNIAAVRSAFRCNGRLVMAMELVEGRTLRELMGSGPVDLGSALDYTRQALDALEYAHARGVIHRDVKPENMLITAKGQLKLTDFGLAKILSGDSDTQSAAPMGSLRYMSPEQVRAQKTIDERSDLYSLGVVLYELSTGQPPFREDNPFDLMKAHVESMPPLPAELNPALPEQLNGVILGAVRKDPAERFATAAEFREALETVPRPRRAPASPASRGVFAGAWRWIAGWRFLWRALAAATGLLVGIGVVWTLAWLSSVEHVPVTEAPVVGAPISPPEFAYRRTPAAELIEEDTSPARAASRGSRRRSPARSRTPRESPGEALPVPSSPLAAPEKAREALSAAPSQPRPGHADVAAKTEEAEHAASVEPGLALIQTFQGDAAAEKIAFGSDGWRLATFGGTGFQVWDLRSGLKSAEFDSVANRIAALAVSADGEKLFTGNTDGSVRIWDVGQQRETAMLGHESGVTALTLSPGGDLLMVGLRDKSVHLWRETSSDGRYKRAERPLKGCRQPPEDITYNGKSNLVAAASKDKQLHVWNASGGSRPERIPALGEGTVTVALSPHGTVVAAAGQGQVGLWHLQTGKRIKTLITGGQRHALGFAAGGRCLAVAADGRSLTVWDVTLSEPVAKVLANSIVRAVSLSQDVNRVAAVDSTGALCVWQMNEAAARVVAQPLKPAELIALLEAVPAGDDGERAEKKKGIFRRFVDAVW